MTLGEIIKKYRDEHDVSMEYVATLCGITKGYVAMLERNVNSKTGRPIKPSIETILKICNGLHLNFNDVFALLDDDYEITLTYPEAVPAPSAYTKFTREDKLILAYFDDLNEEGKALVLDYAELLLSSGKYKKHDSTDMEEKTTA